MKLPAPVAVPLALGVCLLMPSLATASATAPATAPPAPWIPAVNISRSPITIGESFQIATAALNAGGASPDGRICVSFPSLDHPTDVQRVVTGPADDLPGYSRHAAGSALADSACQPMTADYLVVEYGDNDWAGANAESNTFTVTVAPRDSGVFYFYVRATLAASGAPCQGVNAVPTSGEVGYVDQQGWMVGRFSIRVAGSAAPVPSFGNFTLVSPTTVTLGEYVSISATVVDYANLRTQG